LQNYGVTINLSDTDKTDLKYILQIIGEIGRQSLWKISDVECLGESAEILHQISDEERKITGIEFYEIVSRIYQTLDGTFEAYKTNESSHWLLIRSIRGDEFDIETEDEELLNKLLNSFHKVKDLVY
jgi:hypothetical protein